MMKIGRWLLPLLLCVSLAGSGARAETAPDPFKPDPFKWLTKEQIQALTATVPPPSVPNSPADQADLAKVVAAQTGRTPEIEAECKLYQSFSEHLFQSLYGRSLTSENSPKFYHLMKNTLAVTGVVNGAAKNIYKRPRPYQGHPDVIQALFAVNDYGYPSGHSIASFTLATVLGAVFPDKQPAFLDLARRIAQSRVNAGVHYPSDIQEGQVLGKATAAAIIASPAFQADLIEVKAELKP